MIIDQKKQLKTFVAAKVRESPANPSYSKICQILAEFDITWKDNFKNMMSTLPNKSALLTSLQSLVDARNDFAHGGNPTITISNVISYFQDSRTIIEIVDRIII